MRWVSTELAKVAEVSSGDGAPQEASAFGDSGTPFIRAGSLAPLLDGTTEGELELIPLEEGSRRRMRKYPPHTIVFAKSGMSCTKGLVYELRGSAHVVNHLAAIECGNDLNSRFLLRWFELNSPSRLIANPSYPSIKISDIRAEKIPLPPLEEQKRIAGILDAADRLRAQRRETLAQLDTLLQSTFLELFGDPVTNPKGWEVKKFRETHSKVQIGPFGSLLHKEDYIAGGVPLVNPMHIINGRIVTGDQTVLESKAAQLSNYRLRVDDVVMGRRGEMGRCAIVSAIEAGMLCGTGSLYIRPDAEEFTSLFLASLLSCGSMKRHLESLSQGVTMPNLNRTMIEKLKVPLPPIALQRRFAAIVESVEKQKARQRAHLVELDALFASLQSRAFNGEL